MPVISNSTNDKTEPEIKLKMTYLAKHNIKSALSLPSAVQKVEDIITKNLEHFYLANFFKITLVFKNIVLRIKTQYLSS